MGEYDYLHFPPSAIMLDAGRFEALPESARRVFEAVRDEGPLTHKGIQQCTGIPARTIRFALKRLREEGFVDSRCSLRDCRTGYFFVDRRLVAEDALDQARHEAEAAQARGEKTIELA